MRRRKRRGVVQAVAHHGGFDVFVAEFFQASDFICGSHFRTPGGKARRLGDARGRRHTVAGQHFRSDAPVIERRNGVRRVTAQ